MSKPWESEITTLLSGCRIGFLATQGKLGPETSMAPYAIHQGHILLHLSKLAKHTANIADHPKVGLMLCTPETAADSP
ncbi:MAG: pyridoxamine 5'-phosphate oxidase family protein, partial [Mariprofundaceae bacterium]